MPCNQRHNDCFSTCKTNSVLCIVLQYSPEKVLLTCHIETSSHVHVHAHEIYRKNQTQITYGRMGIHYFSLVLHRAETNSVLFDYSFNKIINVIYLVNGRNAMAKRL